MTYFQCDYAEGCHPDILQALLETNLQQTPGYGKDDYCEAARAKIRAACERPDADVHFLVGGTQANTTIIASILRPYQGVISADAGHIATHETGAIEATGHKVLALPSADGTITAEQVEAVCRQHAESFTHEHEVQPGMVYISFPTESGTLYSKAQLTALKAVCEAYGIPLFIDGARMGYGLTSPKNDLTLADIARLCDVFYIGGTKCGALFGEAVVITNAALKKDFRYFIKQRGGMLAKGRLLGVQFGTLFSNGLYFSICEKAVRQALALRQAFEDKGIEMWGNSYTNQQFPILSEAQMDKLRAQGYVYEVWGPAPTNRFITRFCTSWATLEENIQRLLADIAAL